MNSLRWVLFVAYLLACGGIGWQIRGYVEEVRVDRAEREANEAFDREHLGGGK